MTKKDVSPEIMLDDHAENLIEWAQRNARPLSIGAIAVVAAIAIGLFWRSASIRKETNAGRALSEAQRAVGAGNQALAKSDLQRMVQRYDGTKAAVLGRILLAQVFFDEGKADSGLAVLDKAGSPGPFAAALYSNRAAGLEQAGKLPEAAAEFAKAADAALSNLERAQLRGEAARVHQAAGNGEAARKIWEELAADEAGPMAGEAKVRLGELSAKPIAKG